MHPAVILACEQWRCPADIEYQPLTCAATIYCHDVTSHREACRRIQPPVHPHLARAGAAARWTLAVLAGLWLALCTAVGPLYWDEENGTLAH